MSEVVDGVRYLERPCTKCGALMSVAEAALQVADLSEWPKCTACHNMIVIVVHGIAAPQGSKTPWGSEANPNTRPWRAAVAAEAAVVMVGRSQLQGPARVHARFYFPRPKSHYRTGKLAHVLKDTAPSWHTTKPDADKLQRAVGDSLTGIVFRDDSQIAVWRVEKRYGEPARCELEIEAA